MKKKIKNKYLPKFQNSGSLFGSSSAITSPIGTVNTGASAIGGGTDLSALAEDAVSQEQGANMGGIMQGIGAGMGAIGSMIPEDKSKSKEANNANKMKDDVAKANIPFVSWFAGADSMISKAIPGKAGETVGGILNPAFQGIANLNNKHLSGAQKFLNFLPGGNLANPELDPRIDKKYTGKREYATSRLNFGVNTDIANNGTLSHAKYGMPLNDYLIQNVNTPNGTKIYKRKDTNSPF